MNFTETEIKLCRRLHDAGVRREWQAGDWGYGRCYYAILYSETDPMLVSDLWLPLTFQAKAEIRKLCPKDWIHVNSAPNGKVEVGVLDAGAMVLYCKEGKSEMEALLKVWLEILKERK